MNRKEKYDKAIKGNRSFKQFRPSVTPLETDFKRSKEKEKIRKEINDAGY